MNDHIPTREELDELQAAIRALEVQIEEARREPITDLRSPRLEAFWTAAHEVADSESMCGVFDRIAREMGGRSREDDYLVEVELRLTATVWVPVTASNPEEARRNANDADDDVLLNAVRDAAPQLTSGAIDRRIITGAVREDS